MTTWKRMIGFIAALIVAIPMATLAANRISVPVDSKLANQLLTAAQTAEQEGNYSGTLRQYRRWLEIYPNEPTLQAPVYLAMGAASKKAGDATQAKEFNDVAQTLDPGIGARIAKSESGALTRGKGDTAMAIMGAVMGIVQQQMAARQAARAQQQQYAQQPPQYNQPPAGGGYGYPAAPVGNPGYAPPANGYAPMPGYAPQGYAPPGGPSDPNAMGGGAPQNAGYAQPQPYQQPASPQQPQGQYPQQQPTGQYGYAPPPSPYGAPSNYQAAYGATRGGPAPKPLKVIHDHSRLGDKDYFEKGCGALLAVQGGNLTFTPGGGETPLVIPASEIREVRLNTTVGRNIGAFHIATKKGLYLNLAPSTGNRDDGRADVDSLRKELGLSD